MNKVTSALKSTPEDLIAPELIVNYLKQHPDFFVAYPDLLTTLKLPHDSGKAVSLVERQIDILRQRNHSLQTTLNELIANARKNEHLLRHTQNLCLKLIPLKSVEKIQQELQRALAEDFKLPFSQVILFSANNKEEALQELVKKLAPQNIFCGILREEEKLLLFKQEATSVKSVAICPIGQESLRAAIVLGANEADYFTPDMDTLFLSFIQSLVGFLLNKAK